MDWTQKYWDALEQLYWTPKYLGLKSISRRHWEMTGDRVSVPAAMTNPTGPLYRRVTTGKTFPQLVRRQEETFNHIFDLTFGILDGAITNDIFCSLLGRRKNDSLKSYGRELGPEFGFPNLYSFSQHDGYFVGSNWSLAVELKFDAETSIDQLAKYLLAFSVERSVNVERKPISLIYITPNPERLLDDAFPFPMDEIGPHLLDTILAGARSSVVKPLRGFESIAADILDDLSLRAFSWSDMDRQLQTRISEVTDGNPEGRTVARLLQGLSNEIRNHPLSKCTEASESQK
ncbi:hypothetical protein [Pseudohalocynthiibacter sp. F2068]|jgi:hypothetical protein|uniref:hypothetical protein n=1 Tax=Pseudohalocynthiibacter sp. F2068 TaxID=2926418 RepID=UPI001FF2938C|nr:hypothetical protein [Pseudohalocynthiibacter sp. F2068]MCK0104622.1 hypothetical protein [Pseudohalocynthiibacter sp. F2068]